MVLTVQLFTNDVQLRADMLALFPEVQQHPGVQAASAMQTSVVERMVVLAISSPNPELANKTKQYAIANKLESILKQSAIAAEPTDVDMISGWLAQQYRLVSDVHRQTINQEPGALLEQTRQALYGLQGIADPIDLVADPLQLHKGYAAQFLPASVEPLTSHVFRLSDKSNTLLMSFRIQANAFDLQRSEDLLNTIQIIKGVVGEHGATVQASGLPIFAAHGAASARAEISLFGTVSVAAVLVLLLAIFRNLRPMLAVFLCLGAAVGAAFVVTHTVFGEVHLITLVFGVSLIGISVDYSFHYLCDMWSDANWHPAMGIRSVSAGVSFAMLTSVIAFLTFLFTPFPGLKQMAVFSASGLGFAALTVLGLFPWLGPQRANSAPGHALRMTDTWLQRWPFVSGWFKWLMLGLLVLCIGLGLTRLQVNDHISMLQSAPTELLKEDQFVRALSPEQRVSQFYLIEGADSATLMENERAFLGVLATRGIEGVGLSNYYPSKAQQQQDYKLIEQAYFTPGESGDPLMADFMSSLGAGDLYIDVREAFLAQNQTLALEQWVKFAPPHLRHLFVGCDPELCRSVIALVSIDEQLIKNSRGYAGLADTSPAVIWVDRVGSISNLLGKYRVIAGQMLGGVFVLLVLVFVAMFGVRGGMGIAAVPGIAILVSLGVFGLSGQPFSLFNLLGLMMVFGISIDYALFYFLHGRNKPTTALAISLSAATTLLAFGMLSFSNTTIVHTVGLTLAVGITTAFLVAPLAAVAQTKEKIFASS